MIKVVFFAALREKLGCDGIELEASDINTIADVKAQLAAKSDDWRAHFDNAALLSAVNHDMVANDHPVKSGDEVAFFPPVTGG